MRAAEHRAERRAEPLREAELHGVYLFRKFADLDAVLDRGVEDARAVEVDVEAEAAAFAGRARETLRRDRYAARVVVRVFEREHGRLGVVYVAVGSVRGRELLGRGDAAVVVERVGAEASYRGEAADLGAPYVRALAREDALALASRRDEGEQVAHRAGAGVYRRLFSGYLRRVFAERVGRRVVAVDVVADGGARYHFAHLVRGARYGVASEVHYFMHRLSSVLNFYMLWIIFVRLIILRRASPTAGSPR